MMKSLSERWFAYNNPVWGEGDDPVANCIELWRGDEAVKYRKDLHYQRYGSDPDQTDEDILLDFIAVNWAWECKELEGHLNINP